MYFSGRPTGSVTSHPGTVRISRNEEETGTDNPHTAIKYLNHCVVQTTHKLALFEGILPILSLSWEEEANKLAQPENWDLN